MSYQALRLPQERAALPEWLSLLELQQPPLNGLDVTRMSTCAIENVQRYKALSRADLDVMMDLPCGCEPVSLQKLVNLYRCSKCDERYWYSFCLGEVVQDSCDLPPLKGSKS